MLHQYVRIDSDSWHKRGAKMRECRVQKKTSIKSTCEVDRRGASKCQAKTRACAACMQSAENGMSDPNNKHAPLLTRHSSSEDWQQIFLCMHMRFQTHENAKKSLSRCSLCGHAHIYKKTYQAEWMYVMRGLRAAIVMQHELN